jgi:outer membrane protein assembly factor BamB
VTAALGLVGAATLGGCSRGEPVAEIRATPTSAAKVAAGEGAAPLVPNADDWPCWRGSDQTGVAKGPAPTEWSATKNVVWSVTVPGRGHASPIVWGDQVFIATAEDEKKTMSLLCYARDDGSIRWTCPLHEGGFMHVHGKNTQASPTPACDGNHIFWTAMVKDAIWASAVTMEGKIAWQTEVGPFVSMHGYGSSPVLYGNLVIVQGDSNGPGWLAAVDRTTGDIAWRVQRGDGASFATPLVTQIAGKPQVILTGQKTVISYNPLTGDKLWQTEGPAMVCANTPAWRGDLVFVSGGYPQSGVWAIKVDGSGQIVWQKTFKCYVPSLLVDGDRLIVTQDEGIVRCLDADSGEELWQKRLGGSMTSSPVKAGENLYFTNEAGTTFVAAAGPRFESVSENEIGDRCYATPTFCGGRVYLRTFSKLFCLSNRPAAAGSE